MKASPFYYASLKTIPSKADRRAYLGLRGRNLQLFVISSKMRETVLVGGKLSSCSPHHGGSERNDFVEEVKKGLDCF